MSESVFMMIIGGMATAVTVMSGCIAKLWFSLNELQNKNVSLVAEHSKCQIAMAVQDGKIHALETLTTQLQTEIRVLNERDQ